MPVCPCAVARNLDTSDQWQLWWKFPCKSRASRTCSSQCWTQYFITALQWHTANHRGTEIRVCRDDCCCVLVAVVVCVSVDLFNCLILLLRLVLCRMVLLVEIMPSVYGCSSI